MSRFSAASREAAGQVLVLTRQGISLLTLVLVDHDETGRHVLCTHVVPACRHADGTIS
jgi:hypothetical protein